MRALGADSPPRRTRSYNACERTLQYIVDTHPHLELSLLPVPITYPLSHADLVAQVAAVLDAADSDGTGRTVRLALIDAISASPGVVVPWAQLVALFRSRGILSLVDAAHELGQNPRISLRDSKPDFWVSNVHKWGLAPRTVAALYVAKRWQHLVHSIPIGFSYKRREPSDEGDAHWTREFNWSGTVDWVRRFPPSPALSLRQQLLLGSRFPQQVRLADWPLDPLLPRTDPLPPAVARPGRHGRARLPPRRARRRAAHLRLLPRARARGRRARRRAARDQGVAERARGGRRAHGVHGASRSLSLSLSTLTVAVD